MSVPLNTKLIENSGNYGIKIENLKQGNTLKTKENSIGSKIN